MKNFLLIFTILLLSTNLSSQSVNVIDDGSLEVPGKVIRKVFYATGNGPGIGTDNGQITGRILSYTKKYGDTKLRISYTDNFRVIGPNKACQWQFRIDGSACPSQDLVYNLFVSDGNSHQNKTMVGYCDEIPAGTVEIQIWVGPVPGYANCDCYTGWNNQTWLIEVEEVY